MGGAPVKVCYEHGHVKGCRTGRPLCRYRRPAACTCGAYHFPHRAGSGLCGKGCWEELDRPMRGGRAL
jgi:hypothetical protein